MFNLDIKHYAKEFDKEVKVEFKGFDLPKLEETLNKCKGDDVWVRMWERKLESLDMEEEFWKFFAACYNRKSNPNIKLQYFPAEVNVDAFGSFLELINGEETTFWLELGFPNIAITETAIKNNIAVIHFSNCNNCTGNEWQGVLKALGTATMLKLLYVGDPAMNQVIDILNLRSEINNLKIFIGKDEVEEFMENIEIFERLEALKDTIQFPSEIQIGTINFAANKTRTWVPNFNKEKLKDIVDSLNKRKNEKKFWKKVITDAVRKRKMTHFARSKLMFIGKGRAGKTSTIKSLTDKEFDKDQNSTEVADAKGQIRIVTQDIAVSTWKPKNDAGEVVHSRDFEEVLVNARNDDQKGFVNRALYGKLEIRKANLESGRLINGNTRVPGGPRTRLEAVAEQHPQPSFMFAKSIRLDLGSKLLENVAMKGQREASAEGENSRMRRARKKKEKAKQKNKKTITRTITIWDFGGQEVFYTLHHLFFTNNGVYCLVFDFQEMMKNPEKEFINLRFWLDSVTLYAEKAPVFIVATHVHEHSKKDYLKVDEEVIAPLIKTYQAFNVNVQRNTEDNLSFYLIENSLKNNHESKSGQVNKLRRAIENSVKRTGKLFELYAKAVPLSWIYFMNQLVKNDTRKLNFTQVIKKGEEVGLKEAEIEDILRLYHEFGTILSFRDKKSHASGSDSDNKTLENILQEHIILSPQWLVDALKTFIYSSDYHHKKRVRHERFKNELMNLKDYEETGLLLNSTFDKLLAKPIPIEAGTGHKVRYEEYSDKDKEFLLTFFQKMYLMSKFSLTPIEGTELTSKWFVPSMCLRTGKPDGYRHFIRTEKTKHIQIYTARRFPTGFFERVVCILLKLSNQAEGVGVPYLAKDVCVLDLFREKLYVSKKDLSKKKKKLNKKNKAKQQGLISKFFAESERNTEEDIAELEKDQVVHLYVRVLRKNKYRVKMMLGKVNEMINELMKDKLGQLLRPKLLLLFERQKVLSDSDSSDENTKTQRSLVNKIEEGETELLRVDYKIFLQDCLAGKEETQVFKKQFNIDIEECAPFDKIYEATPEPPKDAAQNVDKDEVTFDCFIAHEWGTEADGYFCHDKAKELKKLLKAEGLKVWLDEDNIGDNVALGISKGLTQSAVTIVLLTKRYFSRGDDRNTNAHKEFVMAASFGQEYLLPLVLETEYLTPANWPNGVVKYHLGESLWISYSTDNQRASSMKEIVERVRKLSEKKKGTKK